MGSKKMAPPRLGIGRLGLSVYGKISCLILFFKSFFCFFDIFLSFTCARATSLVNYTKLWAIARGRGCL